MARTVRKVSRASTKNQKSFKLTKKWWIIIASVAAAILIGLGIGLGIHFSGEDEYVSEKIYFVEPVENTNGVEVEFVKENYQTLVRYIKADSIEHLLVFAYDGTAFFADSKADSYSEKYVSLMTRLADLQAEVDLAKTRGVNIELYIVDVSINNYSNADIMLDSKYFGGMYTSEQQTYEPAFLYNQEGEFKSEVEINGTKKIISTTNKIFNPSFINDVINYVKSL